MAERPGPVLVTGANSGIGLASVLCFARRGWDTWGTVRSEGKADELRVAAAEAKAAERVHPVVLDVADHDAVVDRWSELPQLYGVVNNAGYMEMGAIEEVPADEAKAQLDVNVVAPAVVTACALPAVRAAGRGRIVMVSSIAGRAAIMPLNGFYHASKFALEALSDVLRMEVAGFGVRVSIVEPGLFRTNIESRGQAKNGTPFRAGRLALPDGVRPVEPGVGDRQPLLPASRRRCRHHRQRSGEPPAPHPLPRRRRRARRRLLPAVPSSGVRRRGQRPRQRVGWPLLPPIPSPPQRPLRLSRPPSTRLRECRLQLSAGAP